MESKKTNKVLVIPFVKYDEVIINGEKHHEPKNNLSKSDIDYLEIAGYKPVFMTCNDGIFTKSDLPNYFNRGTSIKGFIYYLFDDLTDEDKILFSDKTQEIDLYEEEKREVKTENKEELVKLKKPCRRRFFRRS